MSATSIAHVTANPFLESHVEWLEHLVQPDGATRAGAVRARTSVGPVQFDHRAAAGRCGACLTFWVITVQSPLVQRGECRMALVARRPSACAEVIARPVVPPELEADMYIWMVGVRGGLR